VWPAFGPDVNNYVEPFAGSLAVLLARPGGPGKIETVNDRDRMVANFWRAITYAPSAVAKHCDWPVNEADLHARHRWLVDRLHPGSGFIERMHREPRYFDARIAGWWVWGICQWIGGGWCAEPNNHKHPKLDGIGKGVHSERGHRRGRERVDEADRPELAGAGRGVHTQAGRSRAVRSRQRPSMQGDSMGMGVHGARQLPKLNVFDGCDAIGGVHAPRLGAARRHLTAAGQGVHVPSLGNDRGIHGVSAAPCEEWFRDLQARLRRVRVACGDWKRVLGPSVLGKGKGVGGRRPCAVFLDPPYSHEYRDPGLYSEDDAAISALVRDWALSHGDDPELRIALCGYEGEHDMPGWDCVEWKAARGYAGQENDNRERERIWFSPHCLKTDRQMRLWATS
jgi:hypothetical protein